MMPNSPIETMSAATLPLRNEPMRSSENASMVDLPARSRRKPHHTKRTPAAMEIANEMGMGLSANGHSQSPSVRPSVASHQP